MAVETLIVSTTLAGQLGVKARQASHCQRCATRAGCGLQLLQSGFGGKSKVLEFPMPQALQGRVVPGDRVDIELEDSMMLHLAFIHYLLPLAALLAGTLIANSIAAALALSELWIIPMALCSLAAGLGAVRRYSGSHGLPLTIKASAGRHN